MELDRNRLLEMASEFEMDPFMERAFKTSKKEHLVSFVLEQKRQQFELFVDGFFCFTRFNAKISTYLNNGWMEIRKDFESMDFVLIGKKDSCHVGLDDEGIIELMNIIEEYVAYGGVGKEKETFRIETKKDAFCIAFDPWTFRYGSSSRKS